MVLLLVLVRMLGLPRLVLLPVRMGMLGLVRVAAVLLLVLHFLASRATPM